MMRLYMVIDALLIVSLGCSSVSVAASADEIKAEIKDRCERQMGQYGKSLVLACMQQDKQAVVQIADYQKSHPKITQRCLSQMRQYGFALVAACIEQDVQAQKQIDNW